MKRFADTTAVFEFHVGARVPRNTVRDLLQERDSVATSEHVEREWRRIIVHATSDLLEALGEETDWPGLYSRLSQGYGREPSQRLRALALCVGPTTPPDLAEVKIRAEQLLRVGLSELLQQVVSDVRRPSSCPLALERPVETREGWSVRATCKRTDDICDRVDRVERELGRWTSGATALEAADEPPLKKMGKLATEMAAAPHLRKGKNCYASTGDLGIALDAMSGEEIVTTDHSFEVIAPGVGVMVRRVKTA